MHSSFLDILGLNIYCILTFPAFSKLGRDVIFTDFFLPLQRPANHDGGGFSGTGFSHNLTGPGPERGTGKGLEAG